MATEVRLHSLEVVRVGRSMVVFERLFQRRGTLKGRVVLNDLPPFKGYIVTLYFFPVSDATSPPPFSGDPPKSAYTDQKKIAEAVDLNRERTDRTVDVEFAIERKAGCCFLDIGVILFRGHNGKNHAQVEHFFFSTRPVVIPKNDSASITLPVAWPAIPIENLHQYAKISPGKPPEWY